MEGERQCLKDIHFLQFVVLSHIVEQCFFVANKVTLLQMVMNQHLRNVLFFNEVLACQ